jgi:hypothetical protein
MASGATSQLNAVLGGQLEERDRTSRVRDGADGSMRRLGAASLAVSVGLLSLWVFPALSYVSMVSYGIPAAAFVLGGYAVWRLLAARWPGLAAPFALGCGAPLAFVMVGLVVSVPVHAFLILAPTLVVETVRRLRKESAPVARA